MVTGGHRDWGARMIPGLAAALALMAGPVLALECSPVRFEGRAYTICEIDPASDNLRLFRADAEGIPYGSFTALEQAVGPLSFAMNGGMYHADRSAVGLYIEDGRQEMRLVTSAGPGNFGLLPNGVFCFGDGRAQVIESLAFAADPPDCAYATQSGPMLVIDGELHPRFLPDSTSRNIRNGVGTPADGSRAVFAISDEPVTFHEFGRLFQVGLGLPQALYLDGRVSRLHAPALGRSDIGLRMGPIIAVVDPGRTGG